MRKILLLIFPVLVSAYDPSFCNFSGNEIFVSEDTSYATTSRRCDVPSLDPVCSGEYVSDSDPNLFYRLYTAPYDCNDANRVINEETTIYYRKCNEPDEDYDIDLTKFEPVTSVPPYDCNVDPAELGDLIQQCSSSGGNFYATSKRNCCITSQCFRPIGDTNCSVGEHYDISLEKCVCDNGYPKISDENGTLVCQEPECPAMHGGVPLFNIVEVTSDACSFDEGMDNPHSLMPEPNHICCYGGDPGDNIPCNPACNSDQFCINGLCIDAGYPDDDNSSDSHECPMGEYWSFMENKCVPFFPDDENNSSDGSTGDGSGDGTDGQTDNNGSGGQTDNNSSLFDNPDLFNGSISSSEYQDSMVGASDQIIDHIQKLMDSYVLISLPVTVIGGCDNGLSKSFSILGKSYTLDLSGWFGKINEYNSLIKGLVMFVFGISGLLMVASGRGE